MSERGPATYREARTDCSECGRRVELGRESIVLTNGGWRCTECQRVAERLRDAAPELYEACLQSLRQPLARSTRDQLMAAITKAEGGQS